MCVTSFAIFIFAKSRRKSGLIAFKIISILFVEFLTKFNLQLPVIGRLMCYKDKQGNFRRSKDHITQGSGEMQDGLKIEAVYGIKRLDGSIICTLWEVGCKRV